MPCYSIIMQNRLSPQLYWRIIDKNHSLIFIGRTDAKAEVPIRWPPDAKSQLIRKDPDAGKDWRQEEKGTTDEMVRWHHWLNGHEFEQALGVGDAIQTSSFVNHFSSCLQSFLVWGSFTVSQFFTSGGQSIGVSALASVLPMNIQDWFPLGKVCHCFPIYLPWSDGTRCHDLCFFECWVSSQLFHSPHL